MPDRNEFESSAYLEALRRRTWAAVAAISGYMESVDMAGRVITEIRLQGPDKTGEGYRAIIKGRDEQGGQYVAFANGEDVAGVLAAIKSQAEATGIKWRPDKPWSGPAG